MDAEKAKQVLKQEEDARREQCQKELNAILEKYKFRLSASVLITESNYRVVHNLVSMS